MQNKLIQFLGGMPFFLLMAEGKGIKMNWARLMEAVLIASATAILTSYVSLREMRVEISYIKTSQQEMKQKISCMDDRLYRLAAKSKVDLDHE